MAALPAAVRAPAGGGGLAVGALVRIVENGRTYTVYDEMFRRLGFTNTTENHVFANGQAGHVFAMSVHPEDGTAIVAVRSDAGAECLIEAAGVEVVAPAPLLVSELPAALAEARAALEVERGGRAAAEARASASEARASVSEARASASAAQLAAAQSVIKRLSTQLKEAGGADAGLDARFLGRVCTLCDTPFSALGGEAPVELGPCGHALCLVCAAQSAGAPLLELVSAPPPASTYLAPPAAGAALPLPGLFCFCCKGSAKERAEAAEAHWRTFVPGLREKKRGVAFRLEVPRGAAAARAAAPWSAAWGRDGAGEVFSLALQPGEGRVAAGTGEDFDVPPGEGNFRFDVAFNGAGVFVWPASAFEGGGGGGGVLLLSRPFTPPLQPYEFRHLRLSLRGPVFLAPPAPPPALPHGWLAPAALDAIAAFSNTPEAAVEDVKPLLPAALAIARRGSAMLDVFLRSFAREEVGPADLGLFGVAGAHGAPPPALRVRAGLPPPGAAPAGEEPSPFSPAIVAPVVCPNTACGAVLAVDVPTSHGADRGLHVSCASCGTGLCGHCGLAWVVPGSATAASHAGALCSEHGVAFSARQGVIDQLMGNAVKQCPNPTCLAPIFRYRGHACHSVTCSRCHLHLCYVCLATDEERGLPSHRGCPSTCSGACAAREAPPRHNFPPTPFRTTINTSPTHSPCYRRL